MKEVRWENLRAPALRGLAADDATVIVPVGSTEQHGPHLPVQVDALLATEVSVRAARRTAEMKPVVVSPTVWMGLAEHHMDFGGTITVDFDTFRAVLRCVCESIARHGFRRILLLNGHGGNVSAFGVIVGELERSMNAKIAAVTYWHLSEVVDSFTRILEQQSNVRHAGEAETSMLLALRPELVDTQALATLKEGDADIVDASGAYRYRPFTELTDTGVLGYPTAATADKGEKLLAAAGHALANVILEDSIWR